MHRPLWLCLCACLAASCSSPADKSSGAIKTGPRLYVTNERSGTLTIIDATTRTAIATISLGKRPRGLRPSPDGRLLYIALSGSPIAGPGVDESKLPPPDKQADGIGVVDLRAGKLAMVLPGGSDPEQVAVSADGARLFVANEDAAQMSVIDVATRQVVQTYKVGS